MKIARIDMGAAGGPKVGVEPLGDYTGLGGRAMTSIIVSKEVNPLAHPLGAENKLVIAPGMLSGSVGAMTGRLSVGCKSPLTGTIKESNAGGQASQVMARLGYAALILEGKPQGDDLYKIFINKDGIQVIVDNSLKLLDNYPLIEKLRQEYGDEVAYISIGSAGERKLLASSIACTDLELHPTRHCGRGGTGAVMGAKRVKAIILDDAGMPMRPPKDPEKYRDANRRFVEGLRKNPMAGQGMPALGTNALSTVINEAGAYPTYNFKQGQFAGIANVNGETLAELEIKRGGKATHGCHRGCVIKCSGIYNDKDGHYLTKQPEYETVWSHGAHCGIDDLDTIAKFDFMDDNVGVDTIDMGVALGIAMDAGLVKFGDREGAIGLLEEVGKGTPLGRIIGSGAAVTGKVFGVERVPVVKDQALSGYDPRAVQGIGVTYATSTQGADHTAGYAIGANILKSGGDLDPLKAEGQVDLCRNLQIVTAAIDATGYCGFIAFPVSEQPETCQAMLDMLSSFSGTAMTMESLAGLGMRILSAERDFNIRAGFTKEHDRLPRFFYNEPVAPHNLTFLVKDEELDELFNW